MKHQTMTAREAIHLDVKVEIILGTCEQGIVSTPKYVVEQRKVHNLTWVRGYGAMSEYNA